MQTQLETTHPETAFHFGEWIQKLRMSRRMSLQEVQNRARTSGFEISFQYVRKIELGECTNIGSDKVQALAAGLNVPLFVLEHALFHKQAPVFRLMGRVAAGAATSANEDEYGEPLHYLQADATDCLTLYYVEINGDSMAPKIEHGDLALIRPFSKLMQAQLASFLHSGRIYLVQEIKRRHNTCKYVIADPQAEGSFWLMAENQQLFSKTPLDDRFTVLGEVIEVRKTLSLSRPTL